MFQCRLVFILLMLAASCSYGLTPIIIEYGYRFGFSVGDLTNSQYGFAIIIFGMIYLVRFRQEKMPQGKDWLVLMGMGVSGAATSIFYFIALSQLPASIAIVLLFQFSWITLIIEILLKKKLPSWEKPVGLAIVILGTVLAAGVFDSDLTDFPPTAVIFGLLAALSFAVYLSLPGYLGGKAAPTARSLVIMIISALFIIPFFPPEYIVSGALGRGLWFYGGLLALIGQVIPVLLMVIAIPHIGGRMAGILGTIELPTTVIAAALLLGEQVSILRALGVALIVFGIVVSEKRSNA